MISLLSEGFALGLATGTTCLATCGPIYAPYLMQKGRGPFASVLALLEISAGRFITYVLVGGLAGYFGSSVSTDNREWFTAVAYILFSIYLLITTFRTHRNEKKCAVHKWYAFADRPFILGVLTGVNICPSFLIAIAKAMDSHGAWAGVVLFVAFFAGTTLFLLPLSFFGVAGNKKLLRQIARIGALCVAIWFIVQGILLFVNKYKESHVAPIDEKDIVSLMDSTTAYFLADSSYTCKSMIDSIAAHRAGMLKRVYVPDSIPNACYLFVPRFSGDTMHTHTSPYVHKGRFVVMLPTGQPQDCSDSAISRIVGHLAFYHFKMDPDSGSVYSVK